MSDPTPLTCLEVFNRLDDYLDRNLSDEDVTLVPGGTSRTAWCAPGNTVVRGHRARWSQGAPPPDRMRPRSCCPPFSFVSRPTPTKSKSRDSAGDGTFPPRVAFSPASLIHWRRKAGDGLPASEGFRGWSRAGTSGARTSGASATGSAGGRTSRSGSGGPSARTTPPTATAWDYFPHDHARSRAYRWGEDGLLGICDRQCRLCFALALWNGSDPILKERLFGLTGPRGQPRRGREGDATSTSTPRRRTRT